MKSTAPAAYKPTVPAIPVALGRTTMPAIPTLVTGKKTLPEIPSLKKLTWQSSSRYFGRNIEETV